MKYFHVLTLAGLAAASPCPYGQLAERGLLSEGDAKNFFDARSGGEAAVEEQMKQKREVEHAQQAEFYKRQLDAGELPLGGGLVNGALKPFTGILKDLDVPAVEPFGLKEIPGNDPAHAYQRPISTDVRGMCPTLNTMANHGYINHNGITTFAQAAEACQITLGFGYDTCVFLSALGLLSGGDLVSGKYSIGGEDSRVPNTLGPSLGISRHGFFEVDNSISRIDTYFGNQANFHKERLAELTEIANKYGGQYGNEAFAEERVLRYKQSRATNPEFNAGVRWLAVTTAERVFIFNALPTGQQPHNANAENVMPFWQNETFPEDWFRRATPYSLADTGVDIVNLLSSSPELTEPGVNEGLNNFVPSGISLADLSPSEASCFLADSIYDETPGFLAPAFAKHYKIFQAFLNGAVKPFFASFNCKSITQLTKPTDGEISYAAGPDTKCPVLVDGQYQC